MPSRGIVLDDASQKMIGAGQPCFASIVFNKAPFVFGSSTLNAMSERKKDVKSHVVLRPAQCRLRWIRLWFLFFMCFRLRVLAPAPLGLGKIHDGGPLPLPIAQAG